MSQAAPNSATSSSSHASDTIGAGAIPAAVSDDLPPVLYHFTTESGMNAILATRRINPSLAIRNPHDVRHGEGQYLSDIPPGTTTSSRLSRIFLGLPFHGRRFTHYLAVDVSGLRVVRGRAGVYVIPNTAPLDVTDRIRDHGSN